jgi:predicted RNase H-related nuclease YkuK (DUF458 family)
MEWKRESKMWASPTKGRMSFEGVIKDIREYVESDKNAEFVLSVGTDSQRHGRDRYKFVSTIVCRKVGNGGRYWESTTWKNQRLSLGEKIWAEAYETLTISLTITEKIMSGEIPADKLKPAIDIGHKGQTKQFIQPITGMFRSYGFEDIDIKPYSYAASVVADRISK